MQKFKLYQIHLTDAEHDKVNAEGHNSVPKHLTKLDMSFAKNEVGSLMYCPQAKIFHEGGSSSSRSPSIAKLKGFHMGKSRVYAMKKYQIKN